MSEVRLNQFNHTPLDLLTTRRSGSAKAMKGPGPTREQILKMIACASRVPDHGKLAPWRFIIFEGEARSRFGEVLVRALHQTEPTASADRVEQERGRLLRAPTVITVVSRVKTGTPIPEWEQILSAGAATQTLCLAAHAQGFVANWITEWYSYHQTIADALSLSEGERIAGFVYVGQPADALVDRPRPNLESIITYYS